jgi:hypothetical protein
VASVRGRIIGVASTLAVFAAALMAESPSALAVTPVTCPGLQAAIDSATAGEVLQLGPGICATNLTVNNTAAFTLQGLRAVLQPLDASQSIVESAADVRFTLHSLTFSSASDAAAVDLSGPGAAITISGNTFTGDHSAGVYISNAGPSTTTQATVISGNTFSGDTAVFGGALSVIGLTAPLTISGNTFTNDTVIGGGGAINVINSVPATGPVQITGNTFTANTAEEVGGAAMIELAHGQLLTLTSNTFQANKITGSGTAASGLFEREGGAVFLAAINGDTPLAAVQSHNTFLNNVIDETESHPAPPVPVPAGGAGEWILGVSVHSTGDRFLGNRIAVHDGRPPEGGALGVFAAPGTTSALPGLFSGTNDLFSGNSTAVGGWGGAIYVGGPVENCTGSCPPSSLTLQDSTVVHNRVDTGAGSEGGAIWGSAHDGLALGNSIVFANTPKPELFGFSSAPPTIRFSDVCAEAGGPAVPSHAGNLCTDPMLTSSGAETAASPTLDAGANALVPAGLTTDLAGNARIRASRLSCKGLGPAVVDMGAYEFVGHGPKPQCLDTSKPIVRIVSRRLTRKHGKASVKLGCPRGQSYCDGTVELDTAAARGQHATRLGAKHFHIKGGHEAALAIHLSSGHLGSASTIKVTVKTVARDKAGRRGRSHRKLTLTLH